MDTQQRLTVPGTVDGLREGTRAFDEFADAHALPPAARWRFQVALDEVLSNVIRHAVVADDGAARAIDLSFALDDGVLTVTVDDDGPEFDPLQLAPPDTTLSLDDRQPGGLGIALVRALMDAVSYERRGDRNHLTMIWRLRADEDPPPATGAGHRHDD